MTDEYDDMSRDELLFRLRDWRELANQRSERIAELETERDQLTGQVTQLSIACQSLEGRLLDLRDERDRLRAVVDGLRGYLSLQDVGEEPSEVFDELRAILAELDASAEATDG